MLPYEGAQCNFDECTFEDPSQSDTPHWRRSTHLSDSDCTTPRSHDAAGPARTEEEGGRRWENIESLKSEIARVELSRDRLPRRLDVAQSPGGAGAMGNFREAVGMNESGPVVPFGHAARREAFGFRMAPHVAGEAGAAPGYGQFGPLPRTASVENRFAGSGGSAAPSPHTRRRGRRQHS